MTPEQKLENHIKWIYGFIDHLHASIKMYKESEFAHLYPLDTYIAQIAILHASLVNLGVLKVMFEIEEMNEVKNENKSV